MVDRPEPPSIRDDQASIVYSASVSRILTSRSMGEAQWGVDKKAADHDKMGGGFLLSRASSTQDCDKSIRISRNDPHGPCALVVVLG